MFTKYDNLEKPAKKQKERTHIGNRDEDAKNWLVYADADADDCIVNALLSPNPLTVLQRKIKRAMEERDIYLSEQEGYHHHQRVIELCQTALNECEMIAPMMLS